VELGVVNLSNVLQHSTTLMTAIVVVVTTAMIVGPKWLAWWSDWKKWKHSHKVDAATNPGVTQRYTRATGSQRPWRVGILVDWVLMMLAAGCLLALMQDERPADVRSVALSALFAATFVVASLRRW